jgi:RNA polymerase sigma factor (sigma-70 family)
MESLALYSRTTHGADLSGWQALFPIPESTDADTERELAERSHRGDKAATGELLAQWGRYAIGRTLRKVRGRWWEGMDIEDCVGWAVVGVLQGIRAYDPERGRLSTCITWWVDESVRRAIRLQRFVRVGPTHFSRWAAVMSAEAYNDRLVKGDVDWAAVAAKVNAYKSRHPTSRGKPVDVTSQELQRSVALVQGTETFRICEYVGGNERGVETVGAPSVSTGSSMDTAIDVRSVLSTLDPRARAIVEMRQGFTGPAMTLSQVGEALHISRERVRQIEEAAMKEMYFALGGPSYLDS